MQPRVKKTICLTILMLTGLWICSCGDIELIDQMDDTYQLFLVVQDENHDIDIMGTDDCNGDGTADDPQYIYGEIGELTIDSSRDAPHLQIQSYRVEYIPQLSRARDGTWAMPVALGQTAQLDLTINVESGSTVTAALYDLMSIGTKDYYATDLDGYLFFQQADYTIRVHLYGTEADKSVELTVDTVVRLMNVACDGYG